LFFFAFFFIIIVDKLLSCHIPSWAPTTSWVQLGRSTILSTLDPDHALTVLFLETHKRTSQWVTYHGIALARTRLTSKFRWNPKPEYTYKAYKILTPGRCGILQSTSLKGPTSSQTHFRPGIGSYTKLSHPDPGPNHTLTVLFLGTHTRTSQWHNIVRFGPRPRPHDFVSGNSHENFPVDHPSWDCSRANSLNFGVLTKPEASELPKSLVLGRDGNIHIRLIGSTPLGDVGSHNPPL
ncbi:hypothetical protein DVH24_002279, partial [Malus domestica]